MLKVRAFEFGINLAVALVLGGYICYRAGRGWLDSLGLSGNGNDKK